MLRSHVVFAVFKRNFWSYFSGLLGYLFIVVFVFVAVTVDVDVAGEPAGRLGRHGFHQRRLDEGGLDLGLLRGRRFLSRGNLLPDLGRASRGLSLRGGGGGCPRTKAGGLRPLTITSMR